MAFLAAADADFCFNLFREMDSNQGSENVFFSSLSLFTALALVRLGARGDCASQIDKVSLDCITNHDFCNRSSGELFFPREYCTAMVSCKGRPLNGSRPGGGNNAACNPCSLSWNISRTAALILCLSVGLEVCFPCQLHLETSVGIQNLQLQLRPTESETMGIGPST